MGMVDEAFETLREYVLDAGSSLPVSSLLYSFSSEMKSLKLLECQI